MSAEMHLDFDADLWYAIGLNADGGPAWWQARGGSWRLDHGCLVVEQAAQAGWNGGFPFAEPPTRYVVRLELVLVFKQVDTSDEAWAWPGTPESARQDYDERLRQRQVKHR